MRAEGTERHGSERDRVVIEIKTAEKKKKVLSYTTHLRQQSVPEMEGKNMPLGGGGEGGGVLFGNAIFLGCCSGWSVIVIIGD